jgi:hypothetical protein
VAGAGVVAGAIVSGLASSAQDRAKQIEDIKKGGNITEAQRADHEAAAKSRDELKTAGLGTFGAAGLLAVLGAGLFVFDRATPGLPTRLRDDAPARPPEAKRPPKVDVSAIPFLGPTGGGVIVELQF